MITLVGVLIDPLQQPCPKAVIRFTALTDSGSVLTGVSATHTTTLTGEYNFTLESGYYRLEILYTDEYHETGNVLVTDTTPTELTLVELVQFTAPYTPPLVAPDDADWNALFEAIIDNATIERQIESQVRDEDLLTNTDKTIHKTDTASMAKETTTTDTGDASAVTQVLAYSDDYDRQASYSKEEVVSGSNKVTNTIATFATADDNTATRISALEGTNGAASQEESITDTEVTKDEVSSFGDSTHISNRTLEDGSVDEMESLSVGQNSAYSRKYVDANALVESFIEQGIIVDNIEAFDRLRVVGGKSTRTIQVDTLNIGDTFSVDTSENTVTVKGVLDISNVDELKGNTGDSEYYQYAYASEEEKSLNIWHIDSLSDLYDVPANSTVYRKHRIITVINGTETIGAWSEPYLLTGKDGAEGDTIYYVFKYSATNTLVDATVDNPPGWSSELQDGMYYRIERLVTNGAFLGDWSTPAKIAGADGNDGEIVFEEYMYSPYGISTPDSNTSGHWHTNFVTGDFYRSSRLIKYPAGTELPIPEGTEPSSVTAWSDPVLLVPRKGYEYYDGIDGYNQATITLYQRSEIEPNTPSETLTYDFTTGILSGDEVADLAGWTQTVPSGSKSLWICAASAVSQNNTDTIAGNEWSSALLGSSGTTIYTEYQYSETEEGTYHDDLLATDYFRRERTVTISEDTGITNSDWSAGVRIRIDGEDGDDGYTPQHGVDYFDGLSGSFVSFQYATTNTEPETPTGGTYDGTTETSPTGNATWTDNPVYTVGVRIWVSSTRYSQNSDGSWSNTAWSTPAAFNGEDGLQVATVSLYQSATSRPSTPSGSLTYTFGTNTLSGTLGNWSQEMPDNTAGSMWFTTATALATATSDTDTIASSEWATASLLVQNGIDGTTGNHGNGSYIVEWASTDGYPGGVTINEPPTTGDVEYYFLGVAGRSSQQGDIVTFQRSPDPTIGVSNQYIRGEQRWEYFTVSVNGNQIVNGTLTAEKLQSELVIGNRIYVTAEDSTGVYTELTLSGSGDGEGLSSFPDARMWVGAELYEESPFRLDKYGNLIATSAVISGRIEADSGYFVGAVYASSGYFQGSLYATSLTFSSSSAIPDSINNTVANDYADDVGTSVANQAATNLSNLANNLYPDQTNIQISGNYTQGVSGWAIDKYGNSEFNNVVVRGEIHADDGIYGGTVIRSSGSVSATEATSADSGESADFNPVLTIVIDTGYTAENYHTNNRYFVASAAPSGSWTLRNGVAYDLVLEPRIRTATPMSTGTYGDATIHIAVDLVRPYTSSRNSDGEYDYIYGVYATSTAKLVWTLSEVLLNE